MGEEDQTQHGQQGHVNHGFSGDSKDKTPAQPSHATAKDHDEDDDEVDRRFGLGPFKNATIGKYLSNLYFFAFLLGNAALLPAAGVKSISVNLQYLKNQFKLGDAEAADIQMANSIGIAVSSIIAGYIGSFHKAHIPMLIGITAFLNGIALITPSFLLFGHPYNMNFDPATMNMIFTPFLCSGPQNLTMPPPPPQPPEVDNSAYAVLLFSQLMSGFLLPLVTVLAPVYIDNNETNKSKLAIYFGIYTLFVECASLAGLAMSGFLATNPVDFKDTQLKSHDQRFVGAWWLPLILFGICLCLIGLSIMQFPKRLISKQRQRRALAEAAISFAALKAEVVAAYAAGNPRHRMAHHDKGVDGMVLPQHGGKGGSEDGTSDNQADGHATATRLKEKRPSIADSIVFDSAAVPRHGFLHGVRDFPMQVYRIFKNPIFMLLIIDAALLAIPLKGSELFRPSYQIFEFSMSIETISTASLGYAITNILGIIAGAAVCWKIGTLKGYALTIFLCFGLSSIIAPLYFVLGCENQDLYGYDGKYGVSLPNVTQECNCYPMFALPTCGDDGRSYHSPCYAGCQAGDGFTFQNCTRQSTLDNGHDAKSMMCDAGCKNAFIGYIIVLSILTFLTEMAVVPRSLMIIRVVEPRDRAFGTCIFIFFFAVFSIPASKLFGHLFEDVGCLIYSGAVCVVYDRQKIRYLMSGVEVSAYIVLFFTTWIMFLIFKMMARRIRWRREEMQQHANPEIISEKL